MGHHLNSTINLCGFAPNVCSVCMLAFMLVGPVQGQGRPKTSGQFRGAGQNRAALVENLPIPLPAVDTRPVVDSQHPLTDPNQGAASEIWSRLHIETDLFPPPFARPSPKAPPQIITEAPQSKLPRRSLDNREATKPFQQNRQPVGPSQKTVPQTAYPRELVTSPLEGTPPSMDGLIMEVESRQPPLIGPAPELAPFSESPPADKSVWAGAASAAGNGNAVSGKPRLIFQPAAPARDQSGNAILRPSVRLAEGPEILATPGLLNATDSFMVDPPPLESWSPLEDASLPSWLGDPARFREPPLLSRLLGWRPFATRRNQYDIGVARERLPFALFEIDSTQPLRNYRLRFDAAYDWESPDRAEFLWSKLGGLGPPLTVPVENSVDYQDLSLLMEVGAPRLTVGTEIPLRFVNPSVLPNTAGLGDLKITQKTLLIEGDDWQLTQVLLTQMNTGTAAAGRGSGHVSMEPGVVTRYEWTPDTLVHAELKFRFPLGGDPQFSGEVLRYGFGIAHVWYDSDTIALIPTLEFVGWSILSGQKTTPVGLAVDLDGENIFNMFPGLRIAWDSGGDWELFELGISSGIGISERHWYRGLLRLDARWSF